MMKGALLVMTALALGSCSKEKFHINGTITEAKDSILYLENISLDGPVAIDSVKLDETGSFDFSEARPEAPEFYRLRIANQFISLSVDSTETISVKASFPVMATRYAWAVYSSYFLYSRTSRASRASMRSSAFLRATVALPK